MRDRRASCSCGQLQLTVRGDPVLVAACHCLECQRRTGSAFGVQAFYPQEQVEPAKGVVKLLQYGLGEGQAILSKADYAALPAAKDRSPAQRSSGPATDSW